MDPVQELAHLGGAARRCDLSCTDTELRRAVEVGTIARTARGRYVLPHAERSLAAAMTYGGHLCLLSAAIHHGWAVRLAPARPQVSLPRNQWRRRRPPAVEAHFLRLCDDDCGDVATTPERTLLDCLRLLPFSDALVVADSALRDGFPPERLHALVRDMRGPGSARARRIGHLADGRPANAFESALRLICGSVDGLAVVPQVEIHHRGEFLGRPDLVDEGLMMAIEADSFEWHRGTVALTADAQRYNALVIAGWMVLRFTWVDVIRHPDDVRQVLEAAVLQRTERG